MSNTPVISPLLLQVHGIHACTVQFKSLAKVLHHVSGGSGFGFGNYSPIAIAISP